MKFIALFLSALFLTLSPVQTPVTPPSEDTAKLPEIAYGTPVLDGYADDEYLESYAYILPKGENLNHPAQNSPAFGAAKAAMENTEGRVYYLYDEEYLYACAVIHDETIMSMGEEWRMATTWPWNDDGAELYFAFSTDHMFAIHTDAAGIRSVVDEKIWGNNHSTAKIYHDTPEEDFAVSQSKNEYVIEIRVPLDEGMTEGSVVGLFLEIDDRYSLANNGDVGALFPKNRDVSDKAYAAVFAPKPVDTTKDQELIAYALNRFYGIMESR